MKLPCLVSIEKGGPSMEVETMLNPFSIDSIERCMVREDVFDGSGSLTRTRVVTRSGDSHVINMHIDEFCSAYEGWMSR